MRFLAFAMFLCLLSARAVSDAPLLDPVSLCPASEHLDSPDASRYYGLLRPEGVAEGPGQPHLLVVTPLVSSNERLLFYVWGPAPEFSLLQFGCMPVTAHEVGPVLSFSHPGRRELRYIAEGDARMSARLVTPGSVFEGQLERID